MEGCWLEMRLEGDEKIMGGRQVDHIIHLLMWEWAKILHHNKKDYNKGMFC